VNEQSFTSYHIEVYINSSWVDLTPDVLHSPAPRWNKGMGNGVLDRVGNPGNLRFSLKNGENNSANLLGYYSPKHANVLTGWDTGLPVRLYFVYEGIEFHKFYGLIEPNGITASPATKGERSVKVSVHDFMSQAADHELKLLEFAESKKIEDVAALIIANMPISPLYTEYGSGSDTFPFVFDTVTSSTSALGEWQKVALSEWGFIYEKSDGTLVVEGRAARTNTENTEISITAENSGKLLLESGGALLLETGGALLLNQVQTPTFDKLMESGTRISYGGNLANRIEGRSYPRRIDAAATTVLFALQTPFMIEAGKTKENYRGEYVDPDQKAQSVTGRDMVSPVSGTDYIANAQEDGGGADKTAQLAVVHTYGVEAVNYDSLTNNDVGDIWVTTLQARGKGVYIDEPVSVVYEDAASQLKHGIYTLKFDMRYQDDPTLVDIFSQLTLTQDKDPRLSIDKATLLANRDGENMFGFLQLDVGTRARFVEAMNAIDGDYYIMGYSAQLIDGKYVFWSPILRDVAVAASTAWLWDESKWDVGTIWGVPE